MLEALDRSILINPGNKEIYNRENVGRQHVTDNQDSDGTLRYFVPAIS